MSEACDRCGHEQGEHDVTAFGDPLGCDVKDCGCREWIEPDDQENNE